MGLSEYARLAYLRSNQPYWGKALLPWWQQCHLLWCSDLQRKTDRRLICSEEKNMLISKHIAGPHANGWQHFFWSSLHEGKKTSLIITWSKWGKILGFQAYQGPVPCRPYKPPAAVCPSFHLITATWGKKTIKTARKFIKGWLILFLLTDWAHIFHAWACISSERARGESLLPPSFPSLALVCQ